MELITQLASHAGTLQKALILKLFKIAVHEQEYVQTDSACVCVCVCTKDEGCVAFANTVRAIKKCSGYIELYE